ncbi:hypothetical protein BsWGS_20757 [Bradybaena similaris]
MSPFTVLVHRLTDIHRGITIYHSVVCHRTFYHQKFNDSMLLQLFLHGCHHLTVCCAHVSCFRQMQLHVPVVTSLEIIITSVSHMLWCFCHSYGAGGKTSQADYKQAFIQNHKCDLGKNILQIYIITRHFNKVLEF